MSDVIPYSNLAENPTTEAVIYWIDDRDEASGDDQTLYFGETESDLDRDITDDDPRELPELEGTFLYVAVATGLDPDTRYYAEIQEDDDTLETCQWVTLPDSLEDRDVKVVVSSDWHKDVDGDAYMNDPEDIDVVWEQEPDISLFAGDYLTSADDRDEEIAKEWVGIFRDYYRRYDDEELVHILAVPGNHEVGNHQWDGEREEGVDPESGYIQFFYGHPRLLDPQGQNYGQIIVSNYLQILALDTHSAFPEDVGEWVSQNIKEYPGLCLPIQHEGFAQLGNRDNNDLAENVRNSWFREFYEAENINFYQYGHVHTEGRAVPLKFVQDDPETSESFETDDGWIIEADSVEEGIVGFGEGWRDDRSLGSGWYVDRVQSEKNFSLVTLSNPEATVQIIDEDGQEIDSESWEMTIDDAPEQDGTPVVTFGDVTLGEVTIADPQQ